MRRVAALLVLALALAGCGGASEAGKGTAQLWVTRDRGAHVILTAAVPAGLTPLQALEREADVKARYGGRFVQAVNGISGSLSGRRDWFYFLNGIEPDVGAAEVTLRPGDVAWWDYRSWAGSDREQQIVVGAFPEPFVHGWAGKRRPVEVRAPAGLRPEANALESLLRGAGGGGAGGAPNLFLLRVDPGGRGATLVAKRGPSNGSSVTFILAGSVTALRAAVRALTADPAVVRLRYEARFDERGRVVG